MPKNTFGGNKAKKHKNRREAPKYIIKADGMDYAIITKILGNGQCALNLIDQSGIIGTVLGHIRGSLRRARLNTEDIVLIEHRTFETQKYDKNNNAKLKNVDITHHYCVDHVNQLIRDKQISATFKSTEKEDEDIIFDANFVEDKSEDNSEDESEDNSEDESEEKPKEKVVKPSYKNKPSKYRNDSKTHMSILDMPIDENINIDEI
jgi:translation initiation factor IF-1